MGFPKQDELAACDVRNEGIILPQLLRSFCLYSFLSPFFERYG